MREMRAAEADSALLSSLPPAHAVELSPRFQGDVTWAWLQVPGSPQQGQLVVRALQATSPLLITSRPGLSGGQRQGEEVQTSGAFLTESL